MTTSSSPGAGPTPSPRATTPARGREPRRVRVGFVVFTLLCAGFLAASLPRYLGLDPARSLVPIRADYVWHYPLLWADIMFGSVALVTACLQIQPWLRRRHPRVHRVAGRVYLVGGVLPGSVAVLGVAPVSSTGFVSAVGNTVLAVLWLGTAIAGWRAARQRRFADHRAWMVRNVALTFSIVLNRVWIGVYVVALSILTPDDPALAVTAGAASVWTSWVVNLVVAEWWILRRRPGLSAPAPRGNPVP